MHQRASVTALLVVSQVVPDLRVPYALAGSTEKLVCYFGSGPSVDKENLHSLSESVLNSKWLSNTAET